MDITTRLGMIGVGNMGSGIATCLVRHGYPLAYLQRPGRPPAAALLAAGARPVPTIAEVTAASDVVIVCVTGTPEVEAVVLGPGGILETMRRGTIVVDHSTSIPSSSTRISAALVEAGGTFVDAPMTGTPHDAEAGRINLLVGADAGLFEELEPLFATYAGRIIHAGPVGAGHQLKLLHNFVSIGFATVLAEAVACATRAGIDIRLFTEVLANGGGRSTMLDRLRPYIETHDTTAYRFSVRNAAKDVRYYTSLAEEVGAARATAGAVGAVLAAAVADGHGDETVPELVTILGPGRREESPSPKPPQPARA